tara:strand:- start:49 stop:225 length:177 start_codon:yes stop_codon:yes gene_type:complete
MTQTTQQLKEKLEELIQNYNETVQKQQQTKEAIIATNAVIQDREDGNTNDSNSTDPED